MENPEKPQNCQKWGVGACTGMGTCSGQYGMYLQCMYNVCLSFTILLHSSSLLSPFSLTPFFPPFFSLPLSPSLLSPSPFSHLTEPTGPPTSFHVVVLNTTAIEVQWNLPLFQLRNGIIRGYRLFIQQEGEEQERTINIVGNDTTEYIISGLEPGTAYIVSALAYTVGDGPRSIHLTVSTPLISE